MRCSKKKRRGSNKIGSEFTTSWETIINCFGYGDSTDMAEDKYFRIFIDDRALCSLAKKGSPEIASTIETYQDVCIGGYQ